MSQAVEDFISTISNELENNDWQFNEQPVKGVAMDLRGELAVYLEDGTVLKVSVVETNKALSHCPGCGEQKPGWPESWGNCLKEKGRVLYVCPDCLEKGVSRE